MDGQDKQQALELKVFLENTDLTRIIGQAHIPETSSTASLTRQRISNSRGDLCLSLSTVNETFTVTGLIDGRFPVAFSLRPGTRSHENLLRFLHNELRLQNAASQKPGETRLLLTEEVLPEPRQDKAKSLIDYIRSKLGEGTVVPASTAPELYERDFQLCTPDCRARQQQNSLRLKHRISVARTADETVQSDLRRFRLFNGNPKPTSLSGRISLEINELPASEAALQTPALSEEGTISISPRPCDHQAMAAIKESFTDYEFLKNTIHQLKKSGYQGSISRLLFEYSARNQRKRARLSRYYHLARAEMNQVKLFESNQAAWDTLNAIENIGIGEVVLISPEGPHAVAGGLAQVISGLMGSLSARGLPVTLISPIYEEANGNKHRNAETLLGHGVRINGKNCPIEKLRDIEVPLGPTLDPGTTDWKQWPVTLRVGVYEARHGLSRIIFLRHNYYGSRLYQQCYADEQLKRAIFLSRGALEVILNPAFGINAQTIISNDWHAGLAAIFAKTDPRYAASPRFKAARSIHIIHNGGADYQGRLPAVEFDQELFPVLNLSGEHYFDLRDPASDKCLNFTAAAARHATGGVITVSKPYAAQLLSDDGSEGLGSVFRYRQPVLFGISNGVDLDSLRRLYWSVGEKARETISAPALYPFKYSRRKFLKFLPDYKKAAKAVVQRRFGLAEDPTAILMSFVSRVAEQKGIQLFTDNVWDEECCALESVLRRHPNVQVFIGGPPVEGDQAANRLRHVCWELGQRYPGRISSRFDFLPHREALEVTLGSDFFLMPSRFEPGGITQLEALAAGTLVIARNVGGIAATLECYDESSNRGNSFLFSDYASYALRDTISYAMWIIGNPEKRSLLSSNAALARHDWNDRAPEYCALFQHISGILQAENSYSHLRKKSQIVDSLRPC